TGKGITSGENPLKKIFKQDAPDNRVIKGDCEKNGDIDVILLPEYFSGAIPGNKNYNGEIIDFIKELAGYSGSVVCGSTLWVENSDLYSNKCIIYGPDEELITTSLKQKPFKSEKGTNFRKGEGFGYFQLNGFKFGISICNDTWWPVSYREGLKECEIVLIPIMSSVENQAMINYGRLTWWNLAMTRSKENVQYLVVADHAAGTRRIEAGRKFTTCGASIVTDPCSRNVNDMARMIKNGNKGLLKVTLNKESLIVYRNYRKSAGMY
ncbi:MAG: carbon-nitrogen hydrolase family protein, partial [Candidatus Hodarchaeales archaeon]